MASTKRAKKRQQKSLASFPYTHLIFSLLFVLLGAGLLIYASIQKIGWVTKPEILASGNPQEQVIAKPAKVYIPRLSRVLYVSDGYVTGDRWAISETGVSYLTTSGIPGETGNAVIYGHNTQAILGGLWRVQDGDTIYVVLDSGDFVKYQVYERKEIKPTQVEILNQSPDSRLTLYTCSGFLDTARFVIVAKKA